jgi:flagellar protein FlaJ
MHLASVDQDLLYAIRAIEVLLESGVGVAEAMKHVADEDYGELSGIFKQIFSDTDGGRAFADAIRTQSRKTDSAGLRRVLTTLVMSIEEDTNVVDRLRSIAEKEAKDRRVELDGFIESLSGVSEQFLILSILGPLIVVIGAVISGIMNDDQLEGAPVGGGLTMPTWCAPIAFIVTGIIMAGLIARTKSTEPGV